MSRQENYGVKHVPLEGDITHAAVGNMGEVYLKSGHRAEKRNLIPQLERTLISASPQNFNGTQWTFL